MRQPTGISWRCSVLLLLAAPAWAADVRREAPGWTMSVSARAALRPARVAGGRAAQPRYPRRVAMRPMRRG